MEKDNPARRLLIILQDGKEIVGHTPAKNAWRQLFCIKNQNDDSILFSRLGKLITLQNIIKDDVEKYHPDELSICNKAISNVNYALSKQNLSSDWNSFISHISTESLDYLKLIAKLLDYEYETDIIEEEKLSEFRNSVDELIKEIKSLEIDVEFKKYLLHYLKKIIDSIDEYNITGITPIIESLEVTLGHGIINKEFGENLKESKLSDKFVNILEKLNSLINTGNNLVQLSNGIINFLPK